MGNADEGADRITCPELFKEQCPGQRWGLSAKRQVGSVMHIDPDSPSNPVGVL